MNSYVNEQANQIGAELQQNTALITGTPIRLYPFKIVSGLSYVTDKGEKPLGTDFGHVALNSDYTAQSVNAGSFSGVTQIESGNSPIIAYWFGVTQSKITNNGIVTNINAGYEPELNNYVVKQFLNPFTNQMEYPWKEVGFIDYSSNNEQMMKVGLDNLECSTYEQVYTYQFITNTWLPSPQEQMEFLYAVVDSRCFCPYLLRIKSVTPNYSPDGTYQNSYITLESVNQYFNNTGRSILTYVKFGAVGDGYAYPQEIIYDGEIITVVNYKLLNPLYSIKLANGSYKEIPVGGVTQICVKNNSLAGQMGALVYGHKYVPFSPTQTNETVPVKGATLTKTTELDSYLIPAQFTTPIKDRIMGKDFYVAGTYSLAMNMLVINEQMWASWKQAKQVYNPIQNTTFQGGLGFNTNNTSPSAPNGMYAQTIANAIKGNYTVNGKPSQYPSYYDELMGQIQNNISNIGSQNLGDIILSNRSGLPLSGLSQHSNVSIITSGANPVTGKGFILPQDGSAFDTRGVSLFFGSNAQSLFFDIQPSLLGPSTNTTNSSIINSLWNPSTETFISPEKFFTLNSLCLINTKVLEINYRDGITYTNTNQGHGGVLNGIKNYFAGIFDKFMGYADGYCEMFLNLSAKSYNVLVPNSLVPLFQQYLNPEGDNYNAIPLDIFDNHNDNNTAVGQLKYVSGYQFQLTDTYQASLPDGTTSLFNTRMWRSQPAYPNGKFYTITTTNGQEMYLPATSANFFEKPVAYSTGQYTPQGQPLPQGYVIDEINVIQLGQSNLHITYLTNANIPQTNGEELNQLVTVGQDWFVNSAKLTNNNIYINNDMDYYAYDEYNISVADNCQPFITEVDGQPPHNVIFNYGKTTFNNIVANKASVWPLGPNALTTVKFNYTEPTFNITENVMDYNWKMPSWMVSADAKGDNPSMFWTTDANGSGALILTNNFYPPAGGYEPNSNYPPYIGIFMAESNTWGSWSWINPYNGGAIYGAPLPFSLANPDMPNEWLDTPNYFMPQSGLSNNWTWEGTLPTPIYVYNYPDGDTNYVLNYVFPFKWISHPFSVVGAQEAQYFAGEAMKAEISGNTITGMLFADYMVYQNVLQNIQVWYQNTWTNQIQVQLHQVNDEIYNSGYLVGIPIINVNAIIENIKTNYLYTLASNTTYQIVVYPSNVTQEEVAQAWEGQGNFSNPNFSSSVLLYQNGKFLSLNYKGSSQTFNTWNAGIWSHNKFKLPAPNQDIQNGLNHNKLFGLNNTSVFSNLPIVYSQAVADLQNPNWDYSKNYNPNQSGGTPFAVYGTTTPQGPVSFDTTPLKAFAGQEYKITLLYYYKK